MIMFLFLTFCSRFSALPFFLLIHIYYYTKHSFYKLQSNFSFSILVYLANYLKWNIHYKHLFNTPALFNQSITAVKSFTLNKESNFRKIRSIEYQDESEHDTKLPQQYLAIT